LTGTTTGTIPEPAPNHGYDPALVADIEKRQAVRNRVLLAVYELTSGGSALESAQRADIASKTGLDQDGLEEVLFWLQRRGLVESAGSLAGDMVLTADGSDRAETLLADAVEVVALSVVELRLLERFVRDAHAAIDRSDLAGDDLADAEAQLATIEAQLRSPRPRRDVVGAAIRALTWVGKEALSGVIGGGMYAGLMLLAG